jgi:hypothetical protein
MRYTMPDYRQSLLTGYGPLVIGVVLVLALCAWWVGSALRSVSRAADYSAHAALAKEICLLLAEVPPGQIYPESLADLQLTFPDGGDDTMLERFEYHSNGTSCTLKTVLRWDGTDSEVITRSFPADAADPW